MIEVKSIDEWLRSRGAGEGGGGVPSPILPISPLASPSWVTWAVNVSICIYLGALKRLHLGSNSSCRLVSARPLDDVIEIPTAGHWRPSWRCVSSREFRKNSPENNCDGDDATET